ncbi:MAG: putative phage tail protein [Candidatus Nanopelagicaceae bacterium]
MDSIAYKNLLNELIPQGLAWNPNPDSNLQKLISGESIEFARLEEEALRVLREINPYTTTELISEWVDIALGDHRCEGLSSSAEELKRAILARLISLGGSDRIYFQEVAKAAGFLVKVSDGFQQFRAGRDRCQDRVLANGFAYTWNVRARTNTLSFFRAGLSRASDRLIYFSNALLECVMNQVKPAHTSIIFSYEDVVQNIDGSLYVDVAMVGAISLIRFIQGQANITANLELADTWTPSGLSSMFTWFDGTDFTTAGALSTWTDKKANRNAIQADAAKQPEKVLNAFNGKPVARFTTGETLSVKNLTQMSADNGIHAFAVMDITSGGGKLFDRNQYQLNAQSNQLNSVLLSDFYQGFDYSSLLTLAGQFSIYGIAYFNGNFYLSADFGLWRLNNNGTWTDVAAGLTNRAPRGPLIVANNKLYAVCSTVNQILVWDGTTANEYTNTVNASADLRDLIYNPGDGFIYIADGQNGKLIRFNTSTNAFSQVGTGATNCNKLACDGTNVYINKRAAGAGDIFVWNGSTFTSEGLSGYSNPSGLTWANGTLWLTEAGKLINKANSYNLASGLYLETAANTGINASSMVLFENQLFINDPNAVVRYKLTGTTLNADNWVKNFDGTVNLSTSGRAEILVNGEFYYKKQISQNPINARIAVYKKEKSLSYSGSVSNQNIVYLGIESTRTRLGLNGQIISELTYTTGTGITIDPYRNPNILLEQIAITNGSLVSFVNDIVTINPANDLSANSKIRVKVDPGAITNFGGIENWNFEVT